jgi:hypothetical protein
MTAGIADVDTSGMVRALRRDGEYHLARRRSSRRRSRARCQKQQRRRRADLVGEVLEPVQPGRVRALHCGAEWLGVRASPGFFRGPARQPEAGMAVGQPADNDVERLTEIVRVKNYADRQIATLITRPSAADNIGEFVAARSSESVS